MAPPAPEENAVPAVPATAFTFEPFNPAATKFDRWIKRLEVSFRIFKVAEADKRDFLLHFMGGATYDVLCNKLNGVLPETKTYAEIETLLKAHFSPAPLEILENFKFNSRKQLENESLQDYVTDLEKLAQTCNFGGHLSNAVRNQFVFGIRNRAIQSRLLEIRDLTLAKAKETAFGMEMSYRGADEMQGPGSSLGLHQVEHLPAKRKPTKQTSNEGSKRSSDDGKRCFRCGEDDHLANECKHHATVCNYCKLRGHLERVCRKKEKEMKQRKDTHFIDDEPVYIQEICHVEEMRSSAARFLLQLEVNGKETTFEVDTGSPVTIIGAADQNCYFPHLNLVPTSTRLVSYCGANIRVLGKTWVEVISQGDTLTLPLYVVDSMKHPLLGRDWLLQIRPDLNRAVGTSSDN